MWVFSINTVVSSPFSGLPVLQRGEFAPSSKGCHFLASVPPAASSDSLSSRLHQAVDLATAGHLLFAGLAVAADRAKPQAWPLVSLLRENVAGLPAIVGKFTRCSGGW